MLDIFTYKCAPLGGMRELEITDHSATLRNDKGKVLDQLDFDDALEARWTENTVRGIENRYMDIERDGKPFRIVCNGMDGADYDTYLEGAGELLMRLSERQPAFEIAVGNGSGMRWTMFLIGCGALLMGVGFPVAAVLTDRPTKKILGALVPMAMLLLIGLMLVASNKPWEKSPRVSAGTFGEALLGDFEDDDAADEAGDDLES